MKVHSDKMIVALLLALTIGGIGCSDRVAASERAALEEVIVTAQKKEESLQRAPIAISALNAEQLSQQGILSLDALGLGAIPSLRDQPFPNSPSTRTITIRGNGPADIGQATREQSVAIYLDGFYLGRAQGLSMDVADLERIEVLRGPQGTLFGRNAVGGAVSMISKRPSGEFAILQTVGTGSLNALQTITRVDLPEFGGFKAKLDYIHSSRDGWVKNSAPREHDYNEFDKDGGRISLSYELSPTVTADYFFDKSRVSATQNYFQTYIDTVGLVGEERDRQSRTRAPVVPLDPTITDQLGHGLTLTWNLSSELTLKSLTGYRKLDEETNNNYGAAIYYNGLMATGDLKQHQWSQEFQLNHQVDRWESVAGLYYFSEDVHEEVQNMFSLDTFGTPPNSPVIPATTIDLFTGSPVPLRTVNADSKSAAAYGQSTWTPPIWDDKLRLTVGLRYTKDKKSGHRVENGSARFSVDTHHVDPLITLNYQWTDDISTYAKWSTAYKAAGVNDRSTSFAPYKNEEITSFELGSKSEFFDRRARINIALFEAKTSDMQIDFANPQNVAISVTTNGTNAVRVRGAELDFAAVPWSGSTVGLSYTYLDGHMPNQPNPLNGGQLEHFELTQTPRHASAVTFDQEFIPFNFGTLTAHLDVTSTSPYAYCPKCTQRFDGYTLLNARITLAKIAVTNSKANFSVAIWGKNLTDEEYVVYSLPVGDPLLAVDQAFGDPRTAGVDLTFKY
jgi:iron complex outermembrane receptor protein